MSLVRTGVVSILLACSSSAIAAPTIATLADFSSEAVLIDFEDQSYGSAITTQYAGDGVVFSEGLFGNTGYGFAFGKDYGDVSACNFYYTGYPDIAVEFSAPTTAAGFYIITNDPDNTTLERTTPPSRCTPCGYDPGFGQPPEIGLGRGFIFGARSARPARP